MEKYMEIALNEARKAYKKLEVPVGAIIIKNNTIIAKAHNLRETKNKSTSHAEILCIEKACKKLNSWRLEDCEMYVTLEPCAMCAGAIIQSRIKNVYIGAKDPKNGCVGSITNIFNLNTTHKTSYKYLENCEECSNILSNFFKLLRKMKN